ncbi:MAG: type II toxin-antitoxin system PemK/MazF family toxin [Burkholderiales bacterium]|nr:type II toxin-antitoxin system PemK/MazF family toxin [Rhodocyclaceae bacterium]
MNAAFEFADVLLVPFPFTDQQGVKQRPAVVVSSRSYNKNRPDVLIMAITSTLRNPNTALAFGEAALADWQTAGLLKPSTLKPVFTTIEQRLVIRQLGKLTATDANALREVLTGVIG